MTVTATNTSTNTTSNTYTLVTGGTSGIGYQCAAQLIQQGKQVIITGQNPERVAKAATRLACRGEVADSSQLDSLPQLAARLSKDNITLLAKPLQCGVGIEYCGGKKLRHQRRL